MWVIVSVAVVAAGAVVVRRVVVPLLDPARLRAAVAALRSGRDQPVAAMTARLDQADVDRAARVTAMESSIRSPRPVDTVTPSVSRVPAPEVPREPAPVVPITRRRSSGVALAAIAAVAGVAALALGSWAFFSMAREEDTPVAPDPASELVEQAVALLANPATQRIPFNGAKGALTFVVGADGDALLIVSGLKVAPAGKSYQAWVIADAGKPVPAGLFSGSTRVVELEQPVPMGATVAITLERAGGVRAPTISPSLVVQRAAEKS